MLKKQVVTEAKILNREYLQEYLKHHKKIISKYAYEYLECLINLDISILKSGYITEEEMQYLMQLGLVQSIAKYNIYEKANKIFEEESNQYDVVISKNNEKKDCLKVLGINGEEQYVIFDYRALNDLIDINLYHIIESSSNRDKEINHLVQRIDDLYNNQAKLRVTSGEKSIQVRIREYQSIRHELMDRPPLSGTKYEALDYFNQKILADYGFASGEIPSSEGVTSKKGNMAVSLTKQYPNINLTQNINYY